MNPSEENYNNPSEFWGYYIIVDIKTGKEKPVPPGINPYTYLTLGESMLCDDKERWEELIEKPT